MEPSWIFPIAQALQQHRGSQMRPVAPQSKQTAAEPADGGATLANGASEGGASRPARTEATAQAGEALWEFVHSDG